MKLEWAPHALADRDAIFDHIEAESPAAAIAIDHEIETQVKRLIRFPQSGRPGRIAGTRELVVNRTPYITAYLITDDTIRILRILHGAQRWPDNADG